jgi:hypothetical protein
MLSSIANIKRGEDGSRPQVPPHVVYASYTGDRSGSMSSQKKASADGVYEWVKDITSGCINNGQEGYVNVVFFDTEHEVRMDYVDVNDVEISIGQAREWSKPRGSTKLYDTAIREINKLRKKVNEHKNNHPELIVKGIFQLFSDGYDNCSKHSKDFLNEAIKAARKEGITCYYLGIGQDAIEMGQQYGFSQDESLTVDVGDLTAGVAFRSCSLNALRSATTGESTPFTQLMRESSAPSQMITNQLTYEPSTTSTLLAPPPIASLR